MVLVSFSNGITDVVKRSKKSKVFRGERLKFLREQLKMSQDDFDQFLAFTQDTVRRYESGESDPSAAVLKDMAERLQVTTDWFLGLSDRPEDSYRPEMNYTFDEKLLIADYRAGNLDKLAYRLLGESIYRKTTKDSGAQNPGDKDPTGDAD